MMRLPLARLLALAAGCIFVIPVTCNSLFSRRPPVDTTNELYEYVTVVGSNIPQRVIKGQPAVTPSPVVIVSREGFIEAMEKRQGTVR